MPSLKDLKYRDSQVLTDRTGHEVDLGNLDRNFSEMVTPEDERVTNPKLQPYMDNPQLGDVEASIEFLKHAREPGDDRQGVSDKTKATIAQKTAEAKKTISAYNKGEVPPKPFGDFTIPGENERESFEQMMIAKKFNGEDPMLINPADKVMALTEDDIIGLYERSAPGGTTPWYLLEPKQQQAFVKNAQGFFHEKFKAENEQQRAVRNEIMGRYDEERKKRDLAFKEGEKRVAASIKEQKELKAKVAKQLEEDKSERVKIHKDIVEQQSKLEEVMSTKDKEGYDREPNKQQVKEQEKVLKTLKERLSELNERITGLPDPEKGLPMTAELVGKYIKEANGNRALARMNAIKDGYNPAKEDATHRTDKQH